MTTPLYPCLWFNNNARQAAEHYCSAFSNAKILSDNGMVVLFEINGKTIMGLNGGPTFKMNQSISLFVNCADVTDVDKIWNRLIENGSAMIELGKHPWNERYGWLQDQFGCSWQISKGGQNEVRPAFLFTGKEFGKTEEAIKLYTGLFPDSKIKQLFHIEQGENKGKVLFSEFSIKNYDLVAMDGPGEHKFNFNEGVSLVVPCKDQAELDRYWNGLIADGGAESQCGWLKDKFGVSWQIIPDKLGEWVSDKDKGKRVMDRLMKMKKLDYAELENA